MNNQHSRFVLSKLLRSGVTLSAIGVLLGGCAIGTMNPESDNQTAASPLAPSTPINLLSTQEEQMLKDATERAKRLHSQLRELESRNVTITRRLPTTTSPRVLANDLKLGSAKRGKGNLSLAPGKSVVGERPVMVTEKFEPLTRFSVEFAPGSYTLDEPNQAALLKNLGITNSSVQKTGGNTRTQILIELSTYLKNGLDSLNRDRIKTITDLLKEAGVPAQTVQLKIRRAEARTADFSRGSASRIVRVIKLDAAAIKS